MFYARDSTKDKEMELLMIFLRPRPPDNKPNKEKSRQWGKSQIPKAILAVSLYGKKNGGKARNQMIIILPGFINRLILLII